MVPTSFAAAVPIAKFDKLKFIGQRDRQECLSDLNRRVVGFQHRRANTWRCKHDANYRLGVFDFSGGDHAERLSERNTHQVQDFIGFELLLGLR